MREAWLAHAARRIAVCVIGVVSAMCYIGCDKASEDPYAELDAKFPEGRPGLADARTRAQDPAYVEKIETGAQRFVSLREAAEKAQAEADKFRGIVREALAKRMKEEPPEAILEAELAKNAHYQTLAKTAAEAKAVAEAQRQANMKAIRDRMHAGARAYDDLRAKADAEARAAGLPVRQDVAAAPTAPAASRPPAAQSKPQAPAAAPTVRELSEATGKPVAPAEGEAAH